MNTIQNTNTAKIFISCGEVSGETLATNLVKAIKEQSPQCEITGMGSTRLQAKGVKILYDYSSISVMGHVEAVKLLPRYLRCYRLFKHYFQTNKPDLVILIDFSGFHLIVAKLAKKFGIKVMYYVSPQIWASRPGRIKRIKKYVDHMAVLFAFEKTLYEKAGVPVTFVGHPLVDIVKITDNTDNILQRYQLNPGAPIIGLLPGSRQREIKYLLPDIIAAADIIRAKQPNAQFILIAAPNLQTEVLQQQAPEHIKIIKNDNYNALSICTAAITASGTATLELALLKIPMVVIYKGDKLSAWLVRRLIQIDHAGLCNIVGPNPICLELLQEDCTPENIAAEINKILQDSEYRCNMTTELANLRQYVNGGNASHQTASLAFEMLAH